MNRKTRRANAKIEEIARREKKKAQTKKRRWMPDWVRNLFDIF